MNFGFPKEVEGKKSRACHGKWFLIYRGFLDSNKIKLGESKRKYFKIDTQQN